MAEIDRDFVGLAALRPVSRRLCRRRTAQMIELDNLVVHAGRAAMASLVGYLVVEWSREQSASHLVMEVHVFNQDALRFYERLGFAPSINRLMISI